MSGGKKMSEAEYKELKENEINCELFADFIRHQEVTRCWRKIEEKK